MCVLASTAAAELPVERIFTEGFKDIVWSSTLIDLQREFPDLARKGGAGNAWLAKDTFANRPAEILFHLKDGKFAKWEGILVQTYDSGQDGDIDFLRVEDAMNRRYRPSSTYYQQERPADIPHAERDTLRRRTRWMTSESRIGLVLAQNPAGRWTIQFAYESIYFNPIETEAAEQKPDAPPATAPAAK